MSAQRYTSCEVSINGKPVPGLSGVSYVREPEELQAFPPMHGTYEATCTMHLTWEQSRPLFEFMEAMRRRGQFLQLLVRRLKYGNRKGRSALRRLRAMGAIA